MGDAPENYFGIADDRELEILGGELAARRLAELERAAPLTSFTRDDLVGVHSYLMQDIYPWAGELRTTVVGAMGMAMCRAQFVDRELDRVIRDIARRPPSVTDIDAALATVADHWAELTMVHPFRDGNSRTQRYFFDQLLRNARWSLDWTRINASRCTPPDTSGRRRSMRPTSPRHCIPGRHHRPGSPSAAVAGHNVAE